MHKLLVIIVSDLRECACVCASVFVCARDVSALRLNKFHFVSVLYRVNVSLVVSLSGAAAL
jgi:hypothetical protein